MAPEVIVGLLSLAGTLIGSLAGIIASSKLTTYRIDQLEKKVDRHNSLIDRMYKLEERTGLQDAELDRLDSRLKKLEEQG